MLALADTILIIAGLLVVVSVLQPLARRFGLPNAVVLAFVGVLIGFAATALVQFGRTPGLDTMAEMVLGVPITSAGFIHIFLPVLLFQAALDVDVRRMMDDAAPIFALAVLAVVVSTGVIGVSLWWASDVSIVACLLVGAIVATTDPAAVVAIFRELGAPSRLTRLVEGESLLNDATAIVLYTVLLAMLLTGAEPSLTDATRMFLVSLLGGAAAGFVGARLATAVLPYMRGSQAAELTLSIGVPYLLFIVCERYLEVSGVVAVVVAGLVVGAVARNRMAPASWAFLSRIWEQLAFLAGSLVFILAAIVVPHLLLGVSLVDVMLVGVVVVAALAARAIVLFAVMPAMALVRLGERISGPYKFVILWGGLRGAVTLALAMSITENSLISPDVQRFVAIVATGFVLFSLLVGGTTLRPLIRLMRIDRLSPIDQAMRAQILSLALDSVRETVEETAKRYNIDPKPARDALRPYRRHVEDLAGTGTALEAIPDRDRITIGLIALVNRERDVIAEHGAGRAISLAIMERLLANTERMADATRSDGRLGYTHAAQARLGFGRRFRFAHLLHRRLMIEGPLEHCIADRFEVLMVTRIVLEELDRFARSKLKRVLGVRVADLLSEILAQRTEAAVSALDALRLQYPEYAQTIEQRFLGQLAVRLESAEYNALRDEALIGPELYGDLKRELQAVHAALERRPRLDLGLDTATLVDKFPMFSALEEAERRKIRALLRPRLAVPGERLITKGERGTSAYFISSGAAEVAAPQGKIRLGRGDFFGEMALIMNQPRQADVVALGYCQLLVLEESAFRRLLDTNPAIKAHMDTVAHKRQRMNVANGT
ncbi:cation:proton antiporter domain-containing protein [Microbaculum sp. FT89]|uniref:cation:proton antiporter n=1 Tax=Microbaculum sp. FT89 TaxID=3447298 RepID=UPI003F5337C8